MELKDILAISGHPGLFKFISQGRNGIIVEGIETKKRMNAYATAKISSMEDIAVFTETGEEPLVEIFKRIKGKESGREAIDPKSNKEALKTYMESVLPEYDKDRVYPSDIKKIITWYNILQRNNILDELIENADKKAAEDEKEPDEAEKKSQLDGEEKESGEEGDKNQPDEDKKE
ncbi:MAG: DUF5606 domain-containing protein [Bacteroidota bacterium]